MACACVNLTAATPARAAPACTPPPATGVGNLIDNADELVKRNVTLVDANEKMKAEHEKIKAEHEKIKVENAKLQKKVLLMTRNHDDMGRKDSCRFCWHEFVPEGEGEGESKAAILLFCPNAQCRVRWPICLQCYYKSVLTEQMERGTSTCPSCRVELPRPLTAGEADAVKLSLIHI